MVRLTRTCSPSCRPVFFPCSVVCLSDKRRGFLALVLRSLPPARSRAVIPPACVPSRDSSLRFLAAARLFLGRKDSVLFLIPRCLDGPSALGSSRLQGFGRGVE